MSTTYSAAVAASKILDKIGGATDRQDLLNKLDELIQAVGSTGTIFGPDDIAMVDGTTLEIDVGEPIVFYNFDGLIEPESDSFFHAIYIYGFSGQVPSYGELFPSRHYKGDATPVNINMVATPIGPFDKVEIGLFDPSPSLRTNLLGTAKFKRVSDL